MKLSELRDSTPGVSATPTQSGAVPEGNDGATGAEEPWGIAQVVTPSGLEIYYQAGPKRLYRIRTYAEPNYPAPWTEVPSVSTVLDVLEKGGLSWWGMKVGIEGLLTLVEMGELDELVGHAITVDDELDDIYQPSWSHYTVDELVDLLKQHKLTVNHVKGQAADRGTNVHSALELYAETGVVPDPAFYPANEAGYVAGLVAFLKDTAPEVERSELMVASLSGYAGRFDLVAKLNGGKTVTKTYPKRADIVDVVEPGSRWLLDLKTSKDVYASYHLQLNAYERAMEECGYGEVDHAGVVRVTSDGRYELVEGRAEEFDFNRVLDVYNIVRRIEGKK